MKTRFITILTTLSVMVVTQFATLNTALALRSSRAAITNAEYCSDIISARIDETLNLLTSLASETMFKTAEVSYKTKAARLTQIANRFDYLMVRVLDADLYVYTENADQDDGKAANLSKRDYLQVMKATLQPQVTDSFLNIQDNKTIIFSIAVPIVDNNIFRGGIFAIIRESEFDKLLSDHHAFLIGHRLQYMSGVENDEYGRILDDELDKVWLLGASKERRLSEITSKETKTGSFWGMKMAIPLIYAYNGVLNTNWNVVSYVSFADTFKGNVFVNSMILLSLSCTIALLVYTINKRQNLLQ